MSSPRISFDLRLRQAVRRFWQGRDASAKK